MSDVLLGLGIGWAAGIAPGPLSVLVVTAALQRGFAAGARIAIAPLITDAPIVALGVAFATGVRESVLDGLSIAGGLYLMWLGVTEIRHAGRSGPTVSVAGDLRRGVLANLLSPHPWLFWITVGGPRVAEAWQRGPLNAAGFVVAFFTVLIGVKLLLAAAAARSGHRLSEVWRRRLATAGGCSLMVLGLVLAAGLV